MREVYALWIRVKTLCWRKARLAFALPLFPRLDRSDCRRLASAGLGIAFIALLAALASPGSRKVAAMDVQARAGVTPGLAQVVTDAVVADLRKGAPGLTIIASEDVRNVLGFQRQKEQLGCEDAACLAEIGGALGVDELVVGSLARLGTSYILDLRLIDARRARVIAETDERLKNGNEEDLLGAADRAVTTLLSPLLGLPPGASASVTISTTGPSHPRLPAILLGIAGLAAGGVAVAGLVEALSFKGWQSQPPGAVIPLATASGNVNTANTWATVALFCGIAGVAGVTSAGFTW